MKAIGAIAVILAAMPFTPAAQAQDATAEKPAPGRFQLERMTDGVVRLDTQTGAMSLCHEKEGNLVCRMAADERAAYEQQLDRLEGRVAALEARAGTASGLVSPGKEMPSDEEVERSIGIMERFMRSFFNLIQEFEAEKEGQTKG